MRIHLVSKYSSHNLKVETRRQRTVNLWTSGEERRRGRFLRFEVKIENGRCALFTASVRGRSHRFMTARIRATNFTASIHESGPDPRVIRLDNTAAMVDRR